MSCSVSQTNTCQTTSSMSQTEEFKYIFLENGYQPPTQDYFNTDEKVHFYTGLHSTEILLTVFDHVSASITRRNQTLSKFQDVFLKPLKQKHPLECFKYGHASLGNVFHTLTIPKVRTTNTLTIAKRVSALYKYQTQANKTEWNI